jgi:hypothetical protein
MLRRRTQLPVAILVAVLAAAPATAEVETYFGFQIGVRSAPPPPTVVFAAEPKVVLVEETRVYVARDYDRDLFRYGGAWFLYADGFWYRSASYRGPFRVVDVRVVPSAVLRVPPSRWKHHPHGGPPGQMKPASHGPRAHAKAVHVKETGKRGKGRDR